MEELTDKQVEAAARELCRLRDMGDPDFELSRIFGGGTTWELLASEVRKFMQIQQAIEHARKGAP